MSADRRLKSLALSILADGIKSALKADKLKPTHKDFEQAGLDRDWIVDSESHGTGSFIFWCCCAGLDPSRTREKFFRREARQ